MDNLALLRRMLRRDDYREAVKSRFGKCGATVSALLQVAEENDALVSPRAILCLVVLGRTEVLDRLLDLCQSSHVGIRASAALAVAGVCRSIVAEKILKRCAGASESQQAALITVFCHLPAPEIEGFLLEKLARATDLGLRRVAGSALAAMRSTAAVPILIDALRTEKDVSSLISFASGVSQICQLGYQPTKEIVAKVLEWWNTSGHARYGGNSRQEHSR